MSDEKNWRFCVSGNIVRTHLDEEGIIRYGTKAFSGGTKVYINGKHYLDYREEWDAGVSSLIVIGKNRFGRYVVEDVPIELVENFRFQTVFKPAVLDLMSYTEALDGVAWWERTAADKREAKAFVDFLNEKKRFVDTE